jgi:hypothetical protein
MTREIPLTTQQLLMSSDDFAYEFGLIPTPTQLERNEKLSLIVFGSLATITIAFLAIALYQAQTEAAKKKNAA